MATRDRLDDGERSDATQDDIAQPPLRGIDVGLRRFAADLDRLRALRRRGPGGTPPVAGPGTHTEWRA